MTRRHLLLLGPILMLASGGVLIGRHGYLAAKGVLAGCLIDRALADHLRDGGIHPPWSWADMHPIAVVEVGRLGVRRIVLRGASGESLAFGVGHVDGTALPNTPGHCVLAGHRDGVFSFLEDLRPGDILRRRPRLRRGRHPDRSENGHGPPRSDAGGSADTGDLLPVRWPVTVAVEVCGDRMPARSRPASPTTIS